MTSTSAGKVSLHGTACKGCRRRGRKCDRTLPTCLSCKDRGVACEGYVTRWPGVAARGKLAGKSIPVRDGTIPTRRTKRTIPHSRATTVHGQGTGAPHSVQIKGGELRRDNIRDRLPWLDGDFPSFALDSLPPRDGLEGPINYCRTVPCSIVELTWQLNTGVTQIFKSSAVSSSSAMGRTTAPMLGISSPSQIARFPCATP